MDEFLFCKLGGRRSKSECLHDMLVSAREGLIKTSIMYDANMSWAPMVKLLKLAEARGLIEEVEAPPFKRRWKKKPTMLWRTTDKGLEYAKRVYESSKLLQEAPP